MGVECTVRFGCGIRSRCVRVGGFSEERRWVEVERESMCQIKKRRELSSCRATE